VQASVQSGRSGSSLHRVFASLGINLDSGMGADFSIGRTGATSYGIYEATDRSWQRIQNIEDRRLEATRANLA